MRGEDEEHVPHILLACSAIHAASKEQVRRMWGKVVEHVPFQGYIFRFLTISPPAPSLGSHFFPKLKRTPQSRLQGGEGGKSFTPPVALYRKPFFCQLQRGPKGQAIFLKIGFKMVLFHTFIFLPLVFSQPFSTPPPLRHFFPLPCCP